MKLRIKFARGVRVKFLGHLDIMRSFQRAFIRAGVKMVYSIGFNPHQKMNFAQPLGVGVLSAGDYLDAEVEDGQDVGLIKEALQKQMGEGFSIIDIKKLAEDAEKGMAAVRAASYTVCVNEGELPDIQHFTEAESVVTLKKTKSGQQEADIKPLVYSISQKDNIYEFTVSAGSENNLKPDLLMQEVYRLSGLPCDRCSYSVTRNELMAEGFIPLIDHQTL